MATIDQADIRGSDHIIKIRREPPLTSGRESGKSLSQGSERGFPFVLASAATDHVFELNCLLQSFRFFSCWKGFYLSCGD